MSPAVYQWAVRHGVTMAALQELAELVKCEAIYLLPGWENSKGATLEMHVAERLGMTVIHERVEQCTL